MMEAYCNRAFDRKEDTEEVFNANRSFLSLKRYPVESITTIEQADNDTQDYESIELSGYSTYKYYKGGIIDFGYFQGADGSTVKVTYTGGYWWETKEPLDNDYPSTKPSGATEIPADLLLAWASQCQRFLDESGSVNISAFDGKESPKANLTLLSGMHEILDRYVRYVNVS